MLTFATLSALFVFQLPADTVQQAADSGVIRVDSADAVPHFVYRSGQEACEDGTLVISTGSTRGTYHRAGVAIAKIIVATTKLCVRLLNSNGSVENIQRLAIKTADLAIVQGDIAYYAAKGDTAFFAWKDDRAATRDPADSTTTSERPDSTITVDALEAVRALIGLHTEQVLIAGDTSMLDALSITEEDVVVVGTEGSGTFANAVSVLGALGIEFNNVDNTIREDPREVLDTTHFGPRGIDVLFLTAGADRQFLGNVRSQGGKLLPLTEEAATKLASDTANPYYDTTYVQVEGRFPCPGPLESGLCGIRTVEIRSLLVSGPGLRDKIGFGEEGEVQGITIALLDSLMHIQRAHERFRAIRTGTVTSNVPIAWHPGAASAYCSRKLLSCEMGWWWLNAAVIPFLFFASLLFGRMRGVFKRWVPARLAAFLVGPFGTTKVYTYLLIIGVQIVLLVVVVVVIRVADGSYAQSHNVPNPFDRMSVWSHLWWGFTYAATGHDNDIFPNHSVAVFFTAGLQVVGRVGLLVLIGKIFSDQLARFLRMGRDLKTLRDHTIICGWNEEATGLVRTLTSPELKGRQQVVVILADRATDPMEAERVSSHGEQVFFLRGQPSRSDDLLSAGVATAYQVIVLADDASPDPDARTVLTVLSIETASQKLQEEKKRTTNIRTVAQLVDPANREALIRVHVDEIVCRAEFEQQLLVQSTLNPGLSRFLGEVLSVDENNEIYEVPVRGNETIRIVECTFDEALVTCRNEGVLLLAIDQGGAPGAVPPSDRLTEKPRTPNWRGSDSLRTLSDEIDLLPASQATKNVRRKLRPMLTNPFREEERQYKIKVGDALLFLAESEKPLERIFGSSTVWTDAFKEV